MVCCPISHGRQLRGGDVVPAWKGGTRTVRRGFPRIAVSHWSLYARLAELDVLRHIEVISCVSGGSIVGAYYYLELRKKLQAASDGELKHADFIEIVQNLERNFVAGVQRNIRLRMLMEFRSNLQVLYRPRSSMTDRLATLYDRELYSRVSDEFGAQERHYPEC